MSKYIIITGGELYNKGAQAMTFITVNQMKMRFPDCECVVISNRDAKRTKAEKELYTFSIERRPSRKEVLTLSIPGLRRLIGNKKFLNYYEHAVLQIDISGYGFGSNWGENKCLNYLRSIKLAKSFRVPVYLMPQSFGPFEFERTKGRLINWISKHILKYPKIIMAREEDGKVLLEEKYGLTNVIKANDIVLCNRKAIDLGAVYKNPTDIRRFSIPNNSVAVIPNAKNNAYGDSNQMYSLYAEIINRLLGYGKNVYLIFHSAEDKPICEHIYNDYSVNPRVVMIKDELSSMEFDSVVGQFDYAIASRFHSIVHAYKNATPALIMGWAVKYNNLAAMFDQEKYQFNVAGRFDENILFASLDELNKKYCNESKIIANRLQEYQSTDLFDLLQINL